MLYTADFETTTNINDCRVWAYGLYNIANGSFDYGVNIEQFITDVKQKSIKQNITLYFHNLKFDGEFIIHKLLKDGFTYVKDRKKLVKNTFSTLITGSKIFYSIEICFGFRGKNRQKVIIYDSLKILPFTIDKIAKDFTDGLNKLEIDYHKERPKNYQLTELEITYLRRDCEIVGKALKTLFEQDLKKMTAGANALYDFKQGFDKKQWERLFPILDYDAEIRESYKGGFTYVNPKYQNKILGKGFVYDVNSIYPWIMYEKDLPFGMGISFEGEYKEDAVFNLYVQYLRCTFKLKENFIPTIQLKSNYFFKGTEYLKDSGNQEVTLCLTSIDLKLFFKHYDVENLEYFGGWKFQSTNTLFKTYVDKWTEKKIEAKQANNKSQYTLAKLMLNSLYGKFGLNPNVSNSYPYLENDIVKYGLHESESRKPLYIPVATFVTAYAREFIIVQAQNNYDIFAYADTDSLHLITDNEPKNILTDDYKLGYFKKESEFIKAKFIRAKCYMETDARGKSQVTIAGMKSSIHQYVNYSNFNENTVFTSEQVDETDNKTVVKIPIKDSKLNYKHVKQGIVLIPVAFTIQA